MNAFDVIEEAKKQIEAANFQPTCFYYFDGKEWVFVDLTNQ